VAVGRTELRETRGDVLALPILIFVVLLAVAVRQFFGAPPSAIVLGVCAGLAVLDAVLARFLLRGGRAKLLVTADEITFTPRQRGAKPQTLRRAPGSTLSFHLQSNGFVGDQIQYLLKLRDDSTGAEMLPGPFGRRRIRAACEAQGWTFG
jgi:hypothetical protein